MQTDTLTPSLTVPNTLLPGSPASSPWYSVAWSACRAESPGPVPWYSGWNTEWSATSSRLNCRPCALKPSWSGC